MNFNVRMIGGKYQEMTVDAIETGTLDKKEAIRLAQKMVSAAGDLLYNVDLIVNSECQVDRLVSREPTDIKDRNGNMIHFGDKVRFADKVEWYKNKYWADVAFGIKTKEQALKEIAALPYEERLVESVQDYEWLLSSEIQTYWEIAD